MTFGTNVIAGNPYGRERLNTVCLLVLTNLDQLLFIVKLYLFVTKQAVLMRRSTVLSLPLQ
jgi:hypothetical protein